MNPLEQLEIATARGNKVHTFDLQGNLLSTREEFGVNVIRQFNILARHGCRLPTGEVCSIQGGMLFPHVVKEDASGRRTTVIRMSFAKWLLMSPFPAWLWIPVACIPYYLALRLAKGARAQAHGDDAQLGSKALSHRWLPMRLCAFLVSAVGVYGMSAVLSGLPGWFGLAITLPAVFVALAGYESVSNARRHKRSLMTCLPEIVLALAVMAPLFWLVLNRVWG